MAVPGLVDIEHGALLVAPNLHWTDVPVIELLRARIEDAPLPLGVDNEANLAALAELWEGVATGNSDFMYSSGEIGVGGGIVLGGELFRGYRGFGGEFGHTTVEVDGLPCACGSRGCLETRAGLEPLLAAAGLNGEAVTSRGAGKPVAELLRRAQDEDASRAGRAGRLRPLARRRARHGREPAEPAGDRPRRLLRADGRVALAGDRLRALLARAGRQRRRPAGAWPPRLGAEAAMRGAAATQLRRVLADPTLAGTG